MFPDTSTKPHKQRANYADNATSLSPRLVQLFPCSNLDMQVFICC